MACISVFAICVGVISMLGRQALASGFLGANYMLGLPLSSADAAKDGFVRTIAGLYTFGGFIELFAAATVFLILLNGRTARANSSPTTQIPPHI